jgi:hypothetical protein
LYGYPYRRFLNSVVVSSPGDLVDSSPRTLVDSAGDLFQGRLIDKSPAAILFW